MIKKILVPYDKSKYSENALNYAINLSKNMKEKQEISLLHVVKSNSDTSMPSFFSRKITSPKTGDVVSLEQYLKDVSIDVKNDAKKILDDKIKQISSDEFSINSVVFFGDPAEEILKFTKLNVVDLIVMGNVGFKGLSKIRTIGSVSRKVLENSKCPVLIVHL
ncbi:MAG: universal stress protein [Nitrososphaeraceae archaeon]